MASNEIIINANRIKSRKYWAIRMKAYHPDETEPFKTKNKSTKIRIDEKRSKIRADAMIPEFVEQFRQELENEPAVDDTSVSYYINKWLDEQSKCVSELTMVGYRSYADKHILPFFEGVSISQFTVRKVQDYIDLKRLTLKADSVRKHMVVINGAADEAQKDGLMSGNFNNRGLRFAKKAEEKFVGKTYTPEQLEALFTEVIKVGEPIQSAIVLAVFYGLRRSEVCGLRWSDVDFDNGVIHIRNTVKQDGSQIFEEERTKTEAGARTLNIVPETFDYLVQLKARHDELGLTRGKVVAWEDDRIMQPSYITHKRLSIMKKAGVEVLRFHDLRHTHASLLLVKGVPINEVSKHLGHESISTTSNIYAHMTDTQREKIANTTNSLFSDMNFSLHPQSAKGNSTETVI